LRNIPEECRSHLHRGGSLKLRMAEFLFQKWNRQIYHLTEKRPLFFTEGRNSKFVIKAGYAVQDVEFHITAFLLLTAVRTSNSFATWLL